MSVLYQENFLAKRNYPPFASNDADLVMDLDLTSSDGSTPAGIAAHGLTVSGTPTFGLLGMRNGHLFSTAFKSADRAALATAGTLYIEFERAGLAIDNTQVVGSYFADSIGRGVDLSAQKFLCQFKNALNSYGLGVCHNNGTGGANIRFIGEVNNTNLDYSHNYMNTWVPGFQDDTIGTMVFTWNTTDLFCYVDGHLIYRTSLAVPFIADTFAELGIGGLASTGNPTYEYGNYYVKRVQVTKKFSVPVMLPLQFALLGDSFVRGADNSVEPSGGSAATVAAINAVQLCTRVAAIPSLTLGQGGFGSYLRALAWEQLGIYFPYYNAGRNGGGYTVPGTGFEVNYTSAINAYRPEIVICVGSVNDNNPSAPVADYITKIKVHLDRMIDGNTALRKILFFETFPGYLPPNITPSVAAKQAEHERLSSLLRASDLDGYRGKVQFISTAEAFAYNAYDTYGSSPANLTSGGPAGTGTDVHLTPRGRAKMASVMWPYVKDILLNPVI